MNALLYKILKGGGLSRQASKALLDHIASLDDIVAPSGTSGQVLTLYFVPGQNQIQTLTNTGDLPTAGTFTITLGDQTTTDIAFDAILADIQTALEALSNIGSGNVTVAGTTLDAGNPTVEFKSALAKTEQSLLVVDPTGLTGAVDISAVETQAGIADGPLHPAWRNP